MSRDRAGSVRGRRRRQQLARRACALDQLDTDTDTDAEALVRAHSRPVDDADGASFIGSFDGSNYRSERCSDYGSHRNPNRYRGTHPGAEPNARFGRQRQPHGDLTRQWSAAHRSVHGDFLEQLDAQRDEQ
jgi:hypothetical protein